MKGRLEKKSKMASYVFRKRERERGGYLFELITGNNERLIRMQRMKTRVNRLARFMIGCVPGIYGGIVKSWRISLRTGFNYGDVPRESIENW